MRRMLFVLAIAAIAFERHQGDKCSLARLIRQSQVPIWEMCSISDDGRWAASSTNQTDLLVWDLVSGETKSVEVGTVYIYYLSPDGARALIRGDESKIVELQGAYKETQFPDFNVAAWSPDGSLIVTVPLDQYSFILRNTVGEYITTWDFVEFSYVPILCWSPSELISLIISNGTENYLAWYQPNGTLVSLVPIPWLSYSSSQCSRDGTVVVNGFMGSIMVTPGGRVTSLGQISPNFRNGMFAVCAARSGIPCDLIDPVTMESLLELPDSQGQHLLGLIGDGTTLLTTDLSQVFWWDVSIPRIRSHPLSDVLAVYGWLDKDNLVLGFNLSIREFNMRSLQFGYSYPYNHASSVACFMDGEIYSLSADGLMTVFAHGEEGRRWDTGYIPLQPIPVEGGHWDTGETLQPTVDGTLSCSNRHVGMCLGSSVIIWSSAGVVVTNISRPNMGDCRIWLYNTSQILISFPDLELWDPRPRTCVAYNSGVYSTFAWSPDGVWLAACQSSEFVKTCVVMDGNCTIVTEVSSPTLFEHASWSPDSNWLVVAGHPPYLVSPKLKMAFPAAQGIEARSVSWNPQTLEIVSTTESVFQLWDPMPTVLSLDAAKYAGQLSLTNVSVIGANFLSLSAPIKAMVRWIDSSTNTPQCLLLNATVVDPFTLSLGDVSLPDPALYTVHIHYPTANSPWMTSQYQFTTYCEGNTRPALSQTGGVTRCVCPQHQYTVSEVDGMQLQCDTCPDGGSCNGSTIVLSKGGYWPRIENQYQFLTCAAGACQAENMCSKCHEGPVCGLCMTGCGQYGFGRCQKCNPVWLDVVILILGFLCWIAFCTIQSLFALGWRNSKSKGNNSAQLAAIIVATTQMNALLLSVDVRVDSLSKPLGFTESSAQDGGIQSAVLSCIAIHSGLSPSHVHFVKQVILLLLPVIGWIVLLMGRCCLRWCGINTSTNIVKVPALVVFSSLQSSIITSLFQTLSCDLVDSQGFRSRLKHDISVACFGKTYWTFIGLVTIPALILTTLVIPLTITWLLRHRPTTSGHLRFLVKSYRMDWWYLVIFYRKVLLSIVVTFTKNPFHVALTLLFASAFNILHPPSTSFVVNASETISLVVSAWIFGVAGAVSVGMTNQFGAPEFLAVGALSYSVQLGLLLYDRCSKRTDDKDNDGEKTIRLEPIHAEPSEPSNTLYSRLLDH